MRRRFAIFALALLSGAAQSGCYYLQAASGQVDILVRREPIDEVLADPDTDTDVARRLRLVQEARDFSVAQLGLPDNGSYRSYAELDRDFVVWSVFAAPEFRMQPVNWCYPIVGCVSYRGYFKEEKANREAQKLANRGFDVHVAGVAAYSTLGRFDDPVLSTMMRWDDAQLVATLFHELAHQVLYIPDDTRFNESFARAVEEFGMEQFLLARDAGSALDAYRDGKALRTQLATQVEEARDDLSAMYAETLDDDEKRLLKEHRLEQLSATLRRLLEDAGRDADGWLAAPLNNARLLSISLYEGRLPAFRRMLGDCDGEIGCFYAEAGRVAEMPADERNRYLDALASRGDGAAGATATSWSRSLRVSP